MRITPHDIARALIDAVEKDDVPVDAACDGALTLLRRKCHGVTPRAFVRVVEKEARKRGITSAGLLIVPKEKSVSAKHLSELLAKKAGKPVPIDRVTDPDIIGGAVVLVDHVRIDVSVKGALKDLLNLCLEPLA